VRARALLLLVAMVTGCRGDASGSSISAEPSAAAVASSSGPLVAPSASPSASAAPPAASSLVDEPLPIARLRCCRVEKRSGSFGAETGVHTSYEADVVVTSSGDRLHAADDLVSDTKEMLIHARSMGRSLHQSRKVQLVSEGKTFVSMMIEERGDTGTGAPFVHHGCKTLQLGTGRVLRLDEVLTADAAARVVAEATRQTTGTDAKLLPASFLLSSDAVSFCFPPRGASLPIRRLSVPLAPGQLRGR
jgi:hypothetical protein